jgi:RNA polymerase sigma-70 factor, ECF subfamily
MTRSACYFVHLHFGGIASSNTPKQPVAPVTPNITQLLVAWNQGDEEALAQLTPLVYRELHRLAHGYLAGERHGHVLQTTALVNEAFVRLIDWKQVEWQSRAHFFGVAATLMRHILVQFARERQALKRGGQDLQVALSEAAGVGTRHNPDLLALDDVLTTLEKLDPRQARTVELRFFGGLSLEEAAEVLRVSVSTVRRDWRMAQAWMRQQLGASV